MPAPKGNKFGQKHGYRYTSEYTAWRNMRARVLNPNDPRYHQYGGRGIAICERWSTFENFLYDMGEAPEGTMLDRIDNDGAYTPENCRWVDSSTSNRNRRSKYS